MALDLTYPNIVGSFGAHNIPGRTESRAFLGWFLENYYRLDVTEAQDALCDGPDDKGVDGLFVDKNLEIVTVFQAKLIQSDKKTLGDSALKQFAASTDQFKTKAGVEHLIATTGNAELRALLIDQQVATLVDKGFGVNGVFITNVNRDDNATTFLAVRSDITLVDGATLDAEWIAPGTSAPMQSQITFSLEGLTPIEYKTTEAVVFIAPLLASELVTLGGIQSTELFDWNVRKSLGRTKVNKAIAESISQQSEHKNFVLYHNGLTMLAQKADLVDDKLVVDGYTVVNGCQSLTTLYEQRSKISNELKVITRVIKLPPESPLATKITRHSNNQNAISARDLQSNSTTQRRLQQEFAKDFPGAVHYEIKRGEAAAGVTITNEEAGKMLLAFDLEQPWACHQSYRLFDDLHKDIFSRPEVNAWRIVVLETMRNAIVDALPKLKNTLAAGYRLTQYFLLYVLRQALDVDAQGKQFVANPQTVAEALGLTSLKALISNILADLIIDLNADLDERIEKGDSFDYKRELKSPVAVRKLTTDLIVMYQKGVKRGKSASFSQELATLAPKPATS